MPLESKFKERSLFGSNLFSRAPLEHEPIGESECVFLTFRMSPAESTNDLEKANTVVIT